MIIVGAGYDPLYEAYKDGRTVSNIVDHNMDGKYEGLDIISEDSEIFDNYDKYKREKFIVAVDKASTREEIFERYTNEGLIMGTVDNSDVKQIDYIPRGCIFMTGSFIGKNVNISKNVKLSFRSMLNHDVEVGKSCIVAPNANLLGYAKIGRESYIGANSTVCPRVEVGENVKVGAGSTIADDTPDNVTIIGYYPVEGLYEIIPKL
jgi:UDP-perosamine 4-acetyltransferase